MTFNLQANGNQTTLQGHDLDTLHTLIILARNAKVLLDDESRDNLIELMHRWASALGDKTMFYQYADDSYCCVYDHDVLMLSKWADNVHYLNPLDFPTIKEAEGFYEYLQTGEQK